ncbi:MULTISPECIES: hypothetical protein [unclassified Gordonia (in: high G+C Gram-positive bacteria)]|uniref:hypothetical protein n=1 Tax=unclassified Gordonia (in: high G+C Gram-positive bacteria) TaxID=2657482 RepID=UPI001F104033|nr:hypothetical protein [Gordonia sp. ABSL49_1]MCH5641905.1 hypothetical protein [Gordonia sp. ABSL49_1]
MAIMNERVQDDSVFLHSGEPRPAPQSLGALLACLRLDYADIAAQRAGLRRWLDDNEPSKRLMSSIERQGFGDLLT